MQQRLPSRLDPPITFAHRGAKAHAPENTLEAFRLARRLGATGLESDVWLTADGVAVLDHDGLARRGVRKKRIAEVTRGELPEHIPTLRELLDDCGTDYHLSLDLKDPNSAAPVVETVAACDPAMLPRVWLCEPDLARAARLAGEDRGVRILQTTRIERVKEGMERRVSRLSAAGVDGINLHRSDWNGGLVALVHRFGLVAFGWDMQHDHELLAGLRMGLDAVYSDHVDRMEAAFRTEIRSGPR